uniref:PRA1 family protein n=1 Tax=Acrobeloides nanus TaxID=290746 RepID=A0A914DFL0_9BILA
MDTAAERRDRRKKKILENAEQRINAILKGPDGIENRPAPVIEGEPISPSSGDESQRTISFEDTEEVQAKNEIHYMEPLYFEFVNQNRQIAFFAGIFLRILVLIGVLTNVVWPWILGCTTFEIFVFQKKKVRYPKHSYAINFLSYSGLTEENVLIIGLMMDILYEILLNSVIAVFAFLSLHALILFGKYISEIVL